MFDNHTDPRIFNSTFVDNLKNPAKMEKLAEKTGAFIKDRVRESSFLDSIIPLQTITADELDRSTEHDEPIKIIDLEPNAEATVLNFKGTANQKWLQGKRFAVPFYKIMTDEIKKDAAELATYAYPVTKVIEDTMIKEIARKRDTVFMEQVEAILDTTNQIVNGGSIDIGKDVFAAGFNMLEAQELSAALILINSQDWNGWSTSTNEDVGSIINEDMVKNGYSYTTVLGRKVIVTNKSELVAPGNAYFFAPPEYLGVNYVHSNVRFQIKNDKDIISMVGWGYYGTGIGNIRSIAKVTFDSWTPTKPVW